MVFRVLMLNVKVSGTHGVWAKENEKVWSSGGRDSVVCGGSFLLPWSQNVKPLLPNDLHRVKETLNVESRRKDQDVQLLTHPILNSNFIPRDFLNFIPDDLDVRETKGRVIFRRFNYSLASQGIIGRQLAYFRISGRKLLPNGTFQ